MRFLGTKLFVNLHVSFMLPCRAYINTALINSQVVFSCHYLSIIELNNISQFINYLNAFCSGKELKTWTCQMLALSGIFDKGEKVAQSFLTNFCKFVLVVC